MKQITFQTFTAIIFFLITILVFSNFLQHFDAGFVPSGDLAVDMLMTNQIRDNGYLLTGHYSRFGFHHPGPFFFYINYFFEKLFISTHLSRYSIWAISTLSLNIFFFMLTAIFIKKIFKKGSVLFSIIALLPSLVFFLNEDIRHLMWMPYRLVFPFMAFTASTILILQRKFQYIPTSMFLGCILIHGYVLMPLFVFVSITFSISLALLLTKKNISKLEIKYIYFSIAIGVFFAIPLIIDFIIYKTSNIEKILSFTRSISLHDKANLNEVVFYTLSYWIKVKYLLFISSFILISTLYIEKKSLIVYRNLLYSLSLVLFISIVFVVYYTTAPKPLYDFMGMYYIGIPLLTCSLLLYFSLIEIKKLKLQILLLILISLLSIIYNRINKIPEPILNEHIITISQSIIDREKKEKNHIIPIDYKVHNLDYFSLLAGVLRYLDDAGFKACITKPELSLEFTEKGLCHPNTAPEYFIDSRPTCNNKCITKSGKYNLSFTVYKMNSDTFTLKGCNLNVVDAKQDSENCFTEKQGIGIVTFGPYIKLPEGKYKFKIFYSSSASASEDIGIWDISADQGRSLFKKGNIKGTNGTESYLEDTFPLIDKSLSIKAFEIRTFLTKKTILKIKKITIKKVIE